MQALAPYCLPGIAARRITVRTGVGRTPCPPLAPALRPARRGPTRPASTASTIAATEGTLSRVATGIPLLEIFQTLTLKEAAVQSSVIITIVVVAVLFGNQIIKTVGNKIEGILDGPNASLDDGDPRKRLARTVAVLLAAAERPAQALLPYFGFTYVCTVLAAFADVAILRVAAAAPTAGAGPIKAFCKGAGLRLLDSITDFAQLMQDFSEVSLIVIAGWWFINLKNRLVEATLRAERRTSEKSEDSIARIIEPVSTLISWATVAGTALWSIKVMGVNIRPLLALGSISTVAIGFASQSVVSNVVSAFSIYTSRPFIAGDRIDLKTMSGGLVISGTVERITPIYTVVKTDTGTPVFVRNKDVASSLMVVNESKMLRNDTTPALLAMDTNVTVRYEDVDIIPAVQEEVTKWMKAHPDLIHIPGATCKCSLKEFSTYGPVLNVKCTLKREADSRKYTVFTEILMRVENAVRSRGGALAVEREHMRLPPPLPPPSPFAGNGGISYSN